MDFLGRTAKRSDKESIEMYEFLILNKSWWDTIDFIAEVERDSLTNSFIGFTKPILDGIPLMKHYQDDIFGDFKTSYNINEAALLLNIHMFQKLFNSR